MPEVTNHTEIDSARKERERDFHNHAFANNIRESLSPFYKLALTAMSAFRNQIVERSRGVTVLEYGCGPGTYSFEIAPVAVRVVGIDISEVAIERARQRAVAARAWNTEFHVMDAENLTLPAGSFDLVCGRAILHHLDLNRAFSTIARVTKPSGVAMFLEPLGHNPAINLYRRFTPLMRTPDEHPLLMRDVELARTHFHDVRIKPFVLTSLGGVAFVKTPLFRSVLKVLEHIDTALFKIGPLQQYAWTSIWSLGRPR